MFLLWHPSLTAINLSYTFPILEASATALCGTTGICIYVCACVQTSCFLSRFFAVFWNLCPVQLRFDRGNFRWKLEAELRIQIWYVFSWTFGFVVAFMVLMAQLGQLAHLGGASFLELTWPLRFGTAFGADRTRVSKAYKCETCYRVGQSALCSVLLWVHHCPWDPDQIRYFSSFLRFGFGLSDVDRSAFLPTWTLQVIVFALIRVISALFLKVSCRHTALTFDLKMLWSRMDSNIARM